jgi:DNA primase
MRGRVLGFAGRVLPGEEVDENQAKYINSPETKLYHKSKLLYGLDISRSEIRKKDRAVVVEGELDMVSSYKAGVGETVAIKGSALTEDQVTLLRRLTNNLVLALDADAAGSEATKRGIAIADKMGMNLLVAEVTGGKDPDEVAQKDSQLWRNLVNKPKSIYDYLIDKAVQAHGTGTGEGKKKITNELAPILANINHVVERDHYVKKLANLLSVTENVLETEISKAEIVGDESSNQTKEPEAMGRKERIERYLVSLFLQMDKDYKKNLDLVDSDWITHEGIGELWQNFTQKVGSKKDKKIKDMVASLPKEKQRLVESLFTVEAIEFKGDQDRLNKAFLRGVDELKNLYKKEKMEALSEKIGLLEGKEKLTLAQEKQLTKLQNDFSQIAKG